MHSNTSEISPKANLIRINQIIEGDCVETMNLFPARSIDLVITDPPYIVNYRDRAGRSIRNDNTRHWIKPTFEQVFRVLKRNSYCVSFCGYNSIDWFLQSAKEAGFRSVGHIIWNKNYPSSTGVLACHHEQAIVLAKGYPKKPATRLKSVQPWHYSGNKLHPTQKHTRVIEPLIKAFSKKGDIALDPFCGSGTTTAAARRLGRSWLGVELDKTFADVARNRMASSA